MQTSLAVGRLAPTVGLAVLFIGSGCAALIYEIVWLQELQLVIGGSAASLAVLLGAFMGGMCAGSLLLARSVSPARHPLRVFAAIEAAIGCWGALLILVMPLVGRLYTAIDGGGPSSMALRALASVLLLLPPTILMGATLPAVSRLVEAVGLTGSAPQFQAAGPPDTRIGAGRLGLLYGANILGAVIGCLSAGFYLLRSFNLESASRVAVLLNVTVAIIALLLARRIPYVPRNDAAAVPNSPGDLVEATSRRGISPSQDSKPIRSRPPGGVYVAIALSGFTALGAEVTWTRLLSLLFGATTYTFSLILAVFLVGLGFGSAVGALARSPHRHAPRSPGSGCRSVWQLRSRTVPGWRNGDSRTGTSTHRLRRLRRSASSSTCIAPLLPCSRPRCSGA